MKPSVTMKLTGDSDNTYPDTLEVYMVGEDVVIEIGLPHRTLEVNAMNLYRALTFLLDNKGLLK